MSGAPGWSHTLDIESFDIKVWLPADGRGPPVVCDPAPQHDAVRMEIASVAARFDVSAFTLRRIESFDIKA